MPEQTRPSSTPTAPENAGELNLVQADTQKPRLKRRNLKAKPAALDPLPDAPKAAPVSTSSVVPAATASATLPAPAPSALAAPAEPTVTPSNSAVNPNPNSNPSPSSNAHPSTLYYSGGVRKEKESAPPMKPSSSSTAPFSPARPASASPSSTASAQARPASNATAPSAAVPARSAAAPTAASASSARPAAASSSSTAARPATAAPVTAAAPVRPTSVSDYRANIERQTREQKTFGGILNVVVGVLIVLFLLGFSLAGYGTYILSKQIHQQSATMADLDSRYTEQNRSLSVQLKSTNDTVSDALAQARAQVQRQQEVIARQQESINKLTQDDAANASALRLERQARASENSSLRVRIRNLEDQPQLK